MTKEYRVLFLCTGNSARSIIAEAVLNRLGRGRFSAYSAGSRPMGTVNPNAVEVLGLMGYPTAGLRSKSWEEFAGAGAAAMDIIITVCDSAAGETCPVWPGHPTTVHWGLPDPAAVDGSREDVQLAFRHTLDQLTSRIEAMLRLSPSDLTPERAAHSLGEIAGPGSASGTAP